MEAARIAKEKREADRLARIAHEQQQQQQQEAARIAKEAEEALVRRQLEANKLNAATISLVSDHGGELVDQPSDGLCGLHSVSHQLGIHNVKATVQMLQGMIASEYEGNSKRYLDYVEGISDEDCIQKLLTHAQEILGGDQVDNLDLQALSNAGEVSICVIDGGKLVKIAAEGSNHPEIYIARLVGVADPNTHHQEGNVHHYQSVVFDENSHIGTVYVGSTPRFG